MLQQILAVTAMNLRNIPNRKGSSFVIVVGIAGVVAVLVALLSMSRGFEQTLKSTGRQDNALLLAAGVNAELSSFISRDLLPVIGGLAGIRKGADGKPLVSAELMIITELKRGEGPKASVNVALRGVEPAGFALRPGFRLVEGKMFGQGLQEVIAGKGAARQFQGISVGSRLKFRGSEWTVSGIFESGGDAHESELWTDADTARTAFGRIGASSLLVGLESPAALDTLQGAIKSDPRLQIDATREQDYFSSLSQNVSGNIAILTNIVAAIMAFGALFGALNTMYTAVSTRQTEIATLRAIGFSGAPVVASVLAEAVLLALAGGVLGAVIAYVLFNGMTVSTLGQNFTQVAFSFAVSPDLVARGLTWALVIGLLGGFFPAVRAARLAVVEALRAA